MFNRIAMKKIWILKEYGGDLGYRYDTVLGVYDYEPVKEIEEKNKWLDELDTAITNYDRNHELDKDTFKKHWGISVEDARDIHGYSLESYDVITKE
jgi:hypothetical protein